MNKRPLSLRFDHREVAVIFSLFIFVSLLMFTVGILVGKGLAQAKYEALLQASERVAKETARSESAGAAERTLASTAEGAAPAEDSMPLKPAIVPLVSALAVNPEPVASVPAPEPAKTAKAPAPPKRASLAAAGVPVPAQAPPGPSSKTAAPESFAKGKFTVQVGSYPTEKDAAERVDALKKLGFPYAYFSAKELGDQRETWFRVWLGYYPDFDAAKRSGELLQQRGEVRNYLVRKTDTAG